MKIETFAIQIQSRVIRSRNPWINWNPSSRSKPRAPPSWRASLRRSWHPVTRIRSVDPWTGDSDVAPWRTSKWERRWPFDFERLKRSPSSDRMHDFATPSLTTVLISRSGGHQLRAKSWSSRRNWRITSHTSASRATEIVFLACPRNNSARDWRFRGSRSLGGMTRGQGLSSTWVWPPCWCWVIKWHLSTGPVRFRWVTTTSRQGPNTTFL